MALNNNPLKQYFRRPAVYIKLPSGGKYYPPGVIDIPENGEIPIYPMTAIDEITTKTPDALFNGTAVAELIKSCVPCIKNPWQINSMDLDVILIGIRAAGGGNEMELDSICPNCSEESKYGLNLTHLLSQMTAGNYDKELEINDLKIKFRPLTYKEMNEAGIAQVEVQRLFIMLENEQDDEVKKTKTQDALKKVTEITIKIVTNAIEYIDVPTGRVDNKDFIRDYLVNCDKNVFVAIRDHNGELKAQAEIKPLHVKCPSCSHEYDQPFTLNASDFFG